MFSSRERETARSSAEEEKMIPLRHACFVCLVALALGAQAQAADGELTIGFVSPVTGNFAELGTAMRNGGQFAVDAVNAAGGLKVGGKTYC